MITVIMSNAVKIDDMPKNFFVYLFATMYVGMAPLTSVAAIIAEEKEHGILKILQFMNVSATEYLIGIGGYVFFICMVCSVTFPVCGNFSLKESILFLIIMALGILISVILGAVIGCLSGNQMSATSITIPVMMVLSFMPMIAIFNANVAKIFKYLYSGQIQILLSGNLRPAKENILILIGNMIIVFVLFLIIYKKSFQNR